MMEYNALKSLCSEMKTLTVFRRLNDDDVMDSLRYYLDCASGDLELDVALDAYSGFVAALIESGEQSLCRYIMRIVGNDENAYIRTLGKGETPSAMLTECVKAELEILQRIADLTPETLSAPLSWGGYLPRFAVEKVDIAEYYRERSQNISKYGYGMYAVYRMFYLDGEGRIVPVKYPDETRLSDLIDYKREQGIIIENTKALLSAIPEPRLDSTRKRILLKGEITSPVNLPDECRFAKRCEYCSEKCYASDPELIEVSKGHFVACHCPLVHDYE